jgi:hypothetical protein
LINLPAQSSDLSSACAFNRSSSPTVAPTIGLRLWSILRLNRCANHRLAPWPTLRLSRCANHRLAPLANPPAVPSGQPPTFAECQPSSFAFQMASGLRRLPTFQLCPRTQPPTLIGCCALWRYLPANLGLASSTNPPATERSNLRLSSGNDLPALPLNPTTDSLLGHQLKRH